MPGLLDAFFSPENSSANMGLFAHMMAGDLPGGLLARSQELEQVKQRAAQQQMQQMQMEQARLALEKAKREASTETQIGDLARSSFRTPQAANAQSMGPMPDGSAVPQVAPGFDMRSFSNGLFGIDPMKGVAFQQSMAKDSPYGKVDPKDYTPDSVRAFAMTGGKDYSLLKPRSKMDVGPGGQVYDPYNIQPGQVLADPNKPFFIGKDGGLAPNSPYQAYETGKARAGATNVNVSTEKSFLSNIGEGFGKGINDAKGAAQGALGTINTVNRLQEALDSGKVLAGPGTKFAQFGLQVGNMLGISGKDANEKLLNTRQAIQSLAQLELDGAQQMKGQGQITEAERGIIKRAASGDVDTMTASELRLLSGLLDRSARTKIRNYNSQVAPIKNMPNASSLAPFLDVQEPPARTPSNVLRFDASGNPVQ
jgi:hypothetical protein